MRVVTTAKYIPIRKGFPKVYRYQKEGNDYFLVDGRSKRWGLNIRKGFNTKDDALTFAQEIEKQILENGNGISKNQVYQDKDIDRFVTQLKPHGKTLGDAVGFYIHHLEQEIKNLAIPSIEELCLKWHKEKRDSKTYPLSEKTKSELRMYSNFITNRLGKFKPNKVNSEMIKKLIEGIGGSQSNTTRRQYFRYIRMFFRWCVLEKYIQTDPTDGIRTIRVLPKEIQIYSPEDIDRLLRLCETKYPLLLGFICLTAFAGLRPTEAQRVEWSDLNFETKEIYVKPAGKTGSRRFVLKGTDTVWIWLENIKTKFPNQPLNPEKSHKYFQKKIHSDFGNWIQDGLRHSFGTYYHNLRRDIPEVVYVMGNSVAIAKKHYVREVTKEWMEKFWSLKPTP
jgi:integrase